MKQLLTGINLEVFADAVINLRSDNLDLWKDLTNPMNAFRRCNERQEQNFAFLHTFAKQNLQKDLMMSFTLRTEWFERKLSHHLKPVTAMGSVSKEQIAFKIIPYGSQSSMLRRTSVSTSIEIMCSFATLQAGRAIGRFSHPSFIPSIAEGLNRSLQQGCGMHRLLMRCHNMLTSWTA